ncbi:MAG: DUF2780 domain-containing protein [Caulobacteraceae bacterium]|nr:DUF2780 domain-containing protein [Caulobacter sp.]
MQMIDELVARAASETGLSPDQSRLGLSAALSLIQKHADAGKVAELFTAVPGTQALADEGGAMTERKSGGLMGGLMRGAGGAGGAAMSDAMALGQRLAKEGVTTSDMQNILPVAVEFVREKTGGDSLREVLRSVPGLGPMLVA